tara:strand:+ start:2190 stop:2537 length:348 start_codon:yes stop_codon:yes gene_type:complete
MSPIVPLNRRVTFEIVSGLTVALIVSCFTGVLLHGSVPGFPSPSPFQRENVAECRRLFEARTAPELKVALRREFRHRHGLSAQRHSKVGNRDIAAIGNLERAQFLLAPRPDVAVD